MQQSANGGYQAAFLPFGLGISLQVKSLLYFPLQSVVQLAFTRPSYTVVEGGGVVNVTVEVVGRGEREIAVRVELSTADIKDSATGKYRYVSRCFVRRFLD